MRLVWMVALCLVGAAGVAGAVPSTISFSGRLSTAAGVVDGSVKLTFALYESAGGGAAVWTEERVSVQVDDGLVFADLGKVETLDSGLFGGAQLFLEIRVDGETLSPRVTINSVPYALHTADSDTLGGTIGAGDVITTVTGGNGISATKAGNAMSVGLSTAGCAAGQVFKFDGSSFACANDVAGGAPVAGNGISVSGSTVSLDTNHANTWGADQAFGDIAVGGRAGIGWTRVVGTPAASTAVANCANWNVSTCHLATATATCPANTVVLGGGCTTNVADNRDVNISRSFPSSDTTWTCGSSSFVSSTLTAFALCARLAL